MLIAARRGQTIAFQREQPFAARLVTRVLDRVAPLRGNAPVEQRHAGEDRITRRSRGSVRQVAPCARS
jgi:hypothetical protein